MISEQKQSQEQKNKDVEIIPSYKTIYNYIEKGILADKKYRLSAKNVKKSKK